MNKHIDRDDQSIELIFNNRSLDADYRTLPSALTPSMKVLDIGCGTGAISNDIAKKIGPGGFVVGVDNNSNFITHGKERFKLTPNLSLFHADLFNYYTDTLFDLAISARVLQWMSDPLTAILKIKQLIKPGGLISILDYNHEAISWTPDPPGSMLSFYQTFLNWRKDAGMDNCIADNLKSMLSEAGFVSINVFNSDEYYDKSHPLFKSRLGIWSQVASSTQMVEEGYLEDKLRLRAIRDYNKWIESDAISMTMKLNEARGVNPHT